MRIGIVGAENEAHCLRMKQVLEAHNAEVLIIDTLAFPDKATLSLSNRRVTYQGRPIDDIATFYIRSVFYSFPPYDLEETRKTENLDLDGWYEEYTAERERQSLLTSWLRFESLRGKRLINPVESFDLHYLKPYQLALLNKNGIPVPRTLVTNDVQQLLEFRDEVHTLVYKPVAGGARCQLMEKEDWDKERLALLQSAPVLFQEYIPGDNIRVYCIGEKVVSSAIIHTNEVDYREHEGSLEKIQLSNEIEQMCVRAMQVCGMRFTGLDLKRKPDGTYVVIECNPSAMFIGFEQATGDPISELFAKFLIAGG
jgi:glutathione synthase/RimK-type ligase-like ATP-grasp enzyme